ncbi:MAG TPA: GNAT family N-acetyltransferase [Saprospiraceae bacterium]|nr:GNAT family N-acetyltransferase [Saprospiraceae bacterium]
MLSITKTNSQNLDFLKLVEALDKELAIRNGDANDFFAQYNKVDFINYVIVAYNNDIPVGCGAIKEYDDTTMEIKRMYVSQEMRGHGIAHKILSALEAWAHDLGFTRCILETGDDMLPAVSLYKKCGYIKIPNYGQYIDVTDSVCFEKYI